MWAIIWDNTNPNPEGKKIHHHLPPPNIIFRSSLLEKKDLSGIFGTLDTESY